LPKLHNDGKWRAALTLQATWRAPPERMNHALSQETLAQIILWSAVLVGLVLIATLVVQKFRGGTADRGTVADEALSKFQEMHGRGDISDADYRKIKSVLGAQLHSELKDGKDKL
jgi:uncharacterized membrane protein